MEEDREEHFCWMDKENSIVSFHKVEDWEKKKFSSRKDMLDYCCVLISMGYRVQ